jgi:hypothetical protein
MVLFGGGFFLVLALIAKLDNKHKETKQMI